MDPADTSYWHVIWTTFLSWPPHDPRGDWSRLSELYGPLVAKGCAVLCPKGLPDSWQRQPAPAGQVCLSPEARRWVGQGLLALTAPRGDRVAGNLPVSALVVAPTAVQLVASTRAESLSQKVGRLKSRLGVGKKHTWGRGFWYARLLDGQARRAAEGFVRGEDTGGWQLQEEAPARSPLMTDLHLAACDGDLGALLAALRAGLDVNVRDSSGYTPLHWAADMGMVNGPREEITATLLRAGADVHARNQLGETPLLTAIRAGNGDIVRQLVEGGADLEARNQLGETALLAAAFHGNSETVAFLLQRGSDVKARTPSGLGTLDVARKGSWEAVLRVLETFVEESEP